MPRAAHFIELFGDVLAKLLYRRTACRVGVT